VQIKKDMKKKILLIALCFVCAASFAQTKKKRRRKPAPAPVVIAPPTTVLSAPPIDTSKKVAAVPSKPFDRPLDGYYKKTNILSARVTPYPSLREADVAYAKRVWREIDLREKMNQYLASPKQRLIDILMQAIADGELTAYDASPNPKNDPDGDSFGNPLTPDQAKSKMAGGDSTAVDKYDANGNKISTKMVVAEFDADSIVKFQIKEDWIFDRQRSVFEPRIIGIAPMVKIKVTGLNLDYQPAFWIYFPDARPILATKEVVNKHNDNTGLSFDDVFVKRIFNSYIVKESNDKDDRIKDYAIGIDKLYEAEKIKKSLLDWELNLWQY
jgi:gliding motility associated protien GldN